MANISQSISIIIPTLNEADNIEMLFKRINDTMKQAHINYEIVLIDDNSTDNTLKLAKELKSTYPVKPILKNGKAGKAYSLLEGFEYAQYELVCMIDADLQYPPEAISEMYKLLIEKDADLVITERVQQKTSFIRQLSSKLFNLMFTRMLFGINYDTQSGLKLFKKSILDNMSLSPSPWSFDLEFIVRALENQYKIINYQIPFNERYAGQAKVHVLETAIELARASIKLRRDTSTKRVKINYKQNLEFNRGVLISLFLSIILLSPFILNRPVYAQSFDYKPASNPINNKKQENNNPELVTSSSPSSPTDTSTSASSTQKNVSSNSSSSSKPQNSSMNNTTNNNASQNNHVTTNNNNVSSTSHNSNQSISSTQSSPSNEPSISNENNSASSNTPLSSGPVQASTSLSPVSSMLSSATKPSNFYKNYNLSPNFKHLLSSMASKGLIIGSILLVLGIFTLLFKNIKNHMSKQIYA